MSAPISSRVVDGWQITVWPDPLRQHQCKVIAIAPSRKRVLHVERLTPKLAESWTPTRKEN